MTWPKGQVVCDAIDVLIHIQTWMKPFHFTVLEDTEIQGKPQPVLSVVPQSLFFLQFCSSPPSAKRKLCFSLSCLSSAWKTHLH